MEDVSKVSQGATPVVLFGLLTCWIGANEDSALRPALAGATIIVFLCTCLTYAIRGIRSRIRRKGISIAIQAAALACSCLAVAFVILANWNLDAARDAHRRERAAQERAKREADQAAGKNAKK
jgi:hypothetical protein